MDGNIILTLGQTGGVFVGIVTLYYKIGKLEGKVEMICKKIEALNRRGKK